MVGIIKESGNTEMTAGAIADLDKICRDGTTLKGVPSAYIFAYTVTDVSLTNATTWYPILFDSAAVAKKGFTHDHTTDPEEITVTATGLYMINYMVSAYASGSIQGHFAAHVTDDGSEIVGSFADSHRGELRCIDNNIVASITAGSVLVLEAGGSVAAMKVNAYDYSYMPNPTYRPVATIMIVRVD